MKPTFTNQKGFTLIEVLVALVIVAVAISAAVRVGGVATQSNGLLRDKSMALLAAQSRLAELRLEGHFPNGMKTFDCDQGRLKLRCEQVIEAGPDSHLLKVCVQVFDRLHKGPPLAQLETLIGHPLIHSLQ